LKQERFILRNLVFKENKMSGNLSEQKEDRNTLEVVNTSPEDCCGSPAYDSTLFEGDVVRGFVQDFYAERATAASSCCGEAVEVSFYTEELTAGLPVDISGFSLGCGDPITLANLQPGEVVLDLGSGGGLDCFLASKQVGETGYVIGIDMTPEMLERARQAAAKIGIENVEFRQGYLEELPVADNSVDVIISNCVINLSPDKPQVFAEIMRTLKPGGRISISDIVTSGELPEAIRRDMQAWGACVAGALDMDDYTAGLMGAGFVEVRLAAKDSGGETLDGIPEANIFSASITALKPHGNQLSGSNDLVLE
jgi:SAM-dependent methyltransferase